MVRRHARHFASIGLAGALLAAGPAQCQETGQTQPPGEQAGQLDLEQFKQNLDAQTKALAAQRRILEEQEKQLAAQKRELDETRHLLEALRARIDGTAPKVDAKNVTQTEPSPTQPVGQAPQPISQSSQPPVAPIFEQPGVLTQRGKFVLEPSLQYSYSSSYRVALLGYTIIPAIHIGLIDIRGVNDSTWISALTARYGMTNRLELEFKVPYVYRTESAVTRPIGGGATQDSVFDTSGKGLGDLEVAARFQINESSGDTPYFIAGVRLKARNGTDPFSVPKTELPGGMSMPSELPTGSGFIAVQPSLSFIYPTDPAVFFGGVSFVKNFDRDVGGGQGTVHPGDAVGINFGMGLALNEKASFSIGVDYTLVGKPSANGGSLLFPAATTTQLATLLFGYSYRFSPFTTVNFSVGAGLTPETPGIQLMLRFPFSF